MTSTRAEQFMAMKKAIEENKAIYNIIKVIYKIFPYFLFLGYTALIAYLLIIWDLRLIRVITVPAGTFIAVTIIRYVLNKPRPYEVMDITPLFSKSTKGKSFPSRHTASAVIISFAFLYVNIWLGIAVFALSLLIISIRPIVGVHFIKDVVAGTLISALLGIIFFFVI